MSRSTRPTERLDSMASSQTGDEHGVLGFSAGQLRQARGRRAPAGVVYLFFTATTTHSATPTPTHTRPVHTLQRRHPAIITEVLRRRVLGRGLQRAHPSLLRCVFLRQGVKNLALAWCRSAPRRPEGCARARRKTARRHRGRRWPSALTSPRPRRAASCRLWSIRPISPSGTTPSRPTLAGMSLLSRVCHLCA